MPIPSAFFESLGEEGTGSGGITGGDVGDVAGGRLKVEMMDIGCLEEMVDLSSSSSSWRGRRAYWTFRGGESRLSESESLKSPPPIGLRMTSSLGISLLNGGGTGAADSHERR
jgi:hypothetical protein